MKFVVHTKETAPPAAREDLETAEKLFGFIPNLFGVLAEAPIALEAYIILTKFARRRKPESGRATGRDARRKPRVWLRILHGCAQHRSRLSGNAGGCPRGAPRRDQTA
jgi:hypothetical protein